jgi:Fe2+ transport system protein FeoA
MTIETIPLHTLCHIRAITDPEVQLVLLRFGLGEGDAVVVTARPHSGPAVLKANQLEVALGRQYLRFIEVEARSFA